MAMESEISMVRTVYNFVLDYVIKYTYTGFQVFKKLKIKTVTWNSNKSNLIISIFSTLIFLSSFSGIII